MNSKNGNHAVDFTAIKYIMVTDFDDHWEAKNGKETSFSRGLIEFISIMEDHDLRIGNVCTNGDDTLMITVWYDTSSSIEVQAIKRLEKFTEDD